MLEAARLKPAIRPRRIVVAVDPPVTGHAGSDECGIVVVGAITEGPPQLWRAVVLEDASVKGATPEGWARAALAAMERHGADRLVAEVNQGGEMVRTILAQAGCRAKVTMVHAARSKAARAEPVALLYEQGRVVHCGDFPALEEEMLALGGEGGPSPDRADALVWAVTRLLLRPGGQGPSVRRL